jgi:hypothetical protein
MPPDHNKYTEKELMVLLCTKVENIEKSSQRTTFALIAVIGGQIGLKFAGTPWYVDLCIYLCLVAGIFLTLSLIAWWKEFSLPQKATRLSGALLLLSSAITQIWVYRPGETFAPDWFAPLINGLLICLAISLIWAGWTRKPKNGKHIC